MSANTAMETLAGHYARRAKEYEEIYYRLDDVQRQREQVMLQSSIKKLLRGANVLEVACGTGYWTQYAAETAGRITATDYNQEVLDLAQQKQYNCPVALETANAYELPYAAETFTGGLAMFWFSHIPKDRIAHLLTGFHRTLKSGSPVVIADNVYVAGVGGELVSKPGDENTYKLRTLKDGTQQEVLKNYFTRDELYRIFKQYDNELTEANIMMGECFWQVHYKVAHEAQQ